MTGILGIFNPCKTNGILHKFDSYFRMFVYILYIEGSQGIISQTYFNSFPEDQSVLANSAHPDEYHIIYAAFHLGLHSCHCHVETVSLPSHTFFLAMLN